jgi:dolichol-phosphate mannosyltransferase
MYWEQPALLPWFGRSEALEGRPRRGTKAVPRRQNCSRIETFRPGYRALSRTLLEASLKRVSVVAPLYNEKDGLQMLAGTLSQLAKLLAPGYELECVLVDDGSKDGTTEEAKKCFASFPLVIHAKHDRNRGLGAAVRTGLGKATGEVICTIDSDCTFDPLRIPEMLALMERENVDIVTASPYHPQGGVENVPPWRLLLSKGASVVYRRVSACKLYSYTSLLRAYRRQVIETIPFESDGFSATTELLLKAAQKGFTVAEIPMVLRTRAIGVSKMKVMNTITMHLGLMSQALWWRFSEKKSDRVVVAS